PINVTKARSMALMAASISVQRVAATPLPWHDVVGLNAPAIPFAGSAYQALTATGNLTATETLNTSGNATYRLFNLYGQQYRISGKAGAPGATVTFLGPTSNDSGSVVADANGNYTIPNLYGGSYTIMPSSGLSLFNPTSRTVTLFGANVTGVNFSQIVS